jgi:hypothetical protein
VLVDAWQATGDGLFGCLPLARDVDGYFANFPSKFIDPEAKPSAFRRDERLSPVDLISGASAVRPVGSVVGCGMLIPLRVIGRHGWMDESGSCTAKNWTTVCDFVR